MQLPGKSIALVFEKQLKKEVAALKKTHHYLKLTVFLVGQSAEQLSFVKMKQAVARRLGIAFEIVHLKNTPTFETFVRTIKEKGSNPQTTGVIIQQPLPNVLQTDCIYDFVPLKKEIEGQRRKTPFFPPIGLAVLTCLKYIFQRGKIDSNLFITPKDYGFFKKTLRHKKIVLVGRGRTGGQPIGKTLAEMHVNFFSINSQTPNPEYYFQNADIVITAVGKKVVFPDQLKAGVILLNVGLRREKGRLTGDYDEEEIKNIANIYTTTPGGIGPLDVLYLYKNLIEAAQLQKG